MEYTLTEQIRSYQPMNEQEERDKELILHCLETEKNIFTRENRLAHMTASAWIVNPERTKVLMVYHNIYHSWSWLGGHADGETDLLKVALKEAREESGIYHVKPVSEKIYSLEVLTVDGHVKRGEYVSSHLHLNVTYGFFADKTAPLRIKPDENSALQWFVKEDAPRASREAEMRVIYEKLNRRI